MRRILTLLFVAVGLISVVVAQDTDEIADLSADGARVSRAGAAGRLTLPSTAARSEIVSAFLRGRHDDATVGSLIVESENPTRLGTVHLRLRQQVAGLDVYGTYVKAAMTSAGELVSVVENLAPAGAPLLQASIEYRDALAAALRRHYPAGPTDLPEVTATGNRAEFAGGGRFYQNPTVTRVAVPLANGRLRIGYLVETWDLDNQLHHTVVNGNGRILHDELRTASDSYLVFPVHPGVGGQTTIQGPGSGNADSPIGWVTNDTTIGNNVDAYLDRDNNNAADANGRPIVSNQTFGFTFDLSVSPTTTTNQMAAVTNLFYLNNFIHDKLYRHGFTEAAGNFQATNFGPGGLGGDPVNAEAQDGGGTNNANFATPTDGSRPRMQMYIWTQTTPSRDGDVDSDIVYHEYGHGLTWRMIGGMSGPLSGAIGEGMSDTLAIYINDNDAVGEYSYNRSAGIRRYRYTNYPLTYGDVTGGSVHNDGEIYAATMWRLRQLWLGAGLSDASLFDRVVDGMNFTPSGPAYEDMREGILQAVSAAGNATAERCQVWTAFAEFGIGVGANGSCKGLRCRNTESFSVPADACSTQPPPSGSITLSATAYKVRGVRTADLSWTGAAGASVDIYRDGALLVTTVNDGVHTDTIGGKGGGTFTYQACEAGSTSACSTTVTIVF